MMDPRTKEIHRSLRRAYLLAALLGILFFWWLSSLAPKGAYCSIRAESLPRGDVRTGDY